MFDKKIHDENNDRRNYLSNLKHAVMNIEKRVEEMCNVGDYIEAKAIKRGKEQAEIRTIRLRLKKKKRPPEETAKLLDMPLGYIQKIADILQKYTGARDLQSTEKLVDMRI